jgi:hypothetical protein
LTTAIRTGRSYAGREIDQRAGGLISRSNADTTSATPGFLPKVSTAVPAVSAVTLRTTDGSPTMA